APAAPAPAPSSRAPAAPAPAVRPAPPSFRDVDASPRRAPIIPPPPQVPAPVTVPAVAAAPLPDGPVDEVDKTVVTPRPTDGDLDATVVVARKRGIRRVLVLDDGRRFPLSGASVVIGRNPVGEPGEQRLAISDETRTLSKTHARLVVTDDEWRLTDLHATNGVVVVADDGSEVLLDAGESVVGTGRFILGEVGMHVIAERDS
ncbi:FHA domain-containing protein, partial [Microbacterium sp.]|uniref:FHA domain-containing protein n=1 Tax=Microbacterium sp. TaxID=51671 RepID=UPI0039E355D6